MWSDELKIVFSRFHSQCAAIRVPQEQGRLHVKGNRFAALTALCARVENTPMEQVGVLIKSTGRFSM